MSLHTNAKYNYRILNYDYLKTMQQNLSHKCSMYECIKYLIITHNIII